jgi:hypothetical protein
VPVLPKHRVKLVDFGSWKLKLILGNSITTLAMNEDNFKPVFKPVHLIQNCCLAVLFFSLCSLLSSCSFSKVSLHKDLTQYVVAADSDGYIINPVKIDAGGSAFFCQQELKGASNQAAYLSNIIQHIKTGTNYCQDSRTRKILIFVHGGMNEQQDSVKRADDLYESIMSDPANPYYPVFISWPSAWWRSYGEHLLRVRQGEKRKSGLADLFYIAPTYPLCLFADMGSAVVNAPAVWQRTYTTTDAKNFTASPYESPLDSYSRVDKVATWMNPGPKFANAFYYQLKARYNDSPTNNIEVSLGHFNFSKGREYNIIGMFALTFPIRLVTTPIIDAFGRESWGNMIRRTKLLIRSRYEPNASFISVDTNSLRHILDASGQGAVAAFFDRLQGLVTNNPGQYEITLIGHSMGTIVLNQAIKAYPDLPYSNIIYMGAACTVSECNDAVTPYLLRHPNAHFYNLCLNPQEETRECNCELLGFIDLVPRGSLLEWLDNFLAAPQTPLDRTMGKWENIIQSTQIFPPQIRGQITIKAFGNGPGDPVRHGDFSRRDMYFWRKAFWNIN